MSEKLKAKVILYVPGVKLLCAENVTIHEFLIEPSEGGEVYLIHNIDGKQDYSVKMGSVAEATVSLAKIEESMKPKTIAGLELNNKNMMAVGSAVCSIMIFVGFMVSFYVSINNKMESTMSLIAAEKSWNGNKPTPDLAPSTVSDDSKVSSLPVGGNEAPLPPVSVNGATGVGVAKTKPVTTGKGIDVSKLPSLPVLPSSALKPGMDGRAGDASDRTKTANQLAKEMLEKEGIDTAYKEHSSIQKALDALGGSDKLPLDMVRDLPHDLAKSLQDAGVVETPEEAANRSKEQGKNSMKVVHIPSEIMEKTRDKDNIPTIPDSNAFLTTSGKIVLPPPGGGEIKKPTDFQAFGLNP